MVGLKVAKLLMVAPRPLSESRNLTRPGATPLTSWIDSVRVSCAVGVVALAGLPTARNSNGSAPIELAPVQTG